MKHRIKLKLNNDLAGKKSGAEIFVDTDNEGIPLEHYWRNRLADAEIDNCVSILEDINYKETPLDLALKGFENG